MNSATSAATREDNPDQGIDLVSVRAGVCWLAGMAIFVLPVAKWWRLTGDADGVIAFIALVMSFGWWLSRALQEAAPRTTVVAALAGLALMAGQLWLLLWLRVEDFWVARWGYFVLALAGTLMLWGWTGPLRGVRALAALVIWAVLPPGSLPFVESPAWLSEMTAGISGFFLARFYAEAAIMGATIHLPHGSVIVGGGCTVLPLWLALAHLFVPAWLIFRLSWRHAAFVVLTTAAAAFVFSIVRVIIMAVIVADPVRFDYWHGPSGASWFTAAGMLVMAWGIDRSLRQPVPAAEKPVAFARGQALTLGVLCGVSVLGAVAATWTGRSPSPAVPSGIPTVAGYSVVEAKSEAIAVEEVTASFPFLWQRQVSYRSGLSGARLEVRLCYAPRLLQGDPVATGIPMPGFEGGWEPATWAEKAVEGVGPIRERSTPGRTAWVTTLPVGASPVATEAQWHDLRRTRTRALGTWLRWLAGQAPLRDKRAYWLELTWTGTGQAPEGLMRTALAEWTSLAMQNLQPSSR